MFGHPAADEDDVRRAVLAGLEITREVSRLSEQAQRRFGIEINVRVGVHRGLVYLDTAQDDVYGLAANLAARVSGLAPPGTVVVSDAVAPLVRDVFELQPRPAAAVKGVEGLIAHHQVLEERAEAARLGRGPLVGRDRELGRLAKSWARAQAGTLTIPGVVFRGEPGIGKSRLAAKAIELAEDSGAVADRWGPADFGPRSHHGPFWYWAELTAGVGTVTIVSGSNATMMTAADDEQSSSSQASPRHRPDRGWRQLIGNDDPHLEPWRLSNRRVGKSGNVGMRHETFRVKTAGIETVYGNGRGGGLGRCTCSGRQGLSGSTVGRD